MKKLIIILLVAICGVAKGQSGNWTGTPITGAPAFTYISITSAYTLLPSDVGGRADATGGAFTITLPTSGIVTGKKYFIKRVNSNSNNITIAGTIDGVTNYTLSAPNKFIEVTYNGSSWDISSNN